MKSILVPTDFSACAVNALNYAATLADNNNAKIFLLHVYHMPVPATEVPIELMEDPEIMEKKFNERMFEMLMKEKSKLGWNAHITMKNCNGNLIDELNNMAENKKIDLVVMGIHGVTILNRFIGSTATEMIRNAISPVMLIPENIKFRPPEKIAVAIDFDHPLDLEKLGVTKHLIRTYNSKLSVFSIINDPKESREVSSFNDAVNKTIGNLNHSIQLVNNNNVAEGILNFIDEHQCDMLVMFHHEHNIFSRMFTKITANEISFNIKIPLLVINSKANIYPRIDL